MVSTGADFVPLTPPLWTTLLAEASRKLGCRVRDTTIADLREGEEAIVLGTIEPAGPLVEGPDGQRCVYWEKRESVGSEASATGGERFWVVDGEGRVLVPAEELTNLSAAGNWTQEVVELATSEISAVSRELSDIKRRLRATDDPELRRRKKHLAKVATLLCAIKAHARGKVHGKGNLTSQAAWIEKNKHLADDGPGKATIEKAVSRLLVVLAPGDRVTVSGRFRMEPMPPGLGSGGGYRDRPTCWVVRNASVVGHDGASADATPPSPERRRTELAGHAEAADDLRQAMGATPFERKVLAVVTGVTLLGGLLTLLRHC